jgi:flagellar biosynthesis/type III secretory pathway protein FliH
MSTVIKANAVHLAPQATAFNFDDLSKQAQAYLDKVRVESQKIVAEAQQQAQVIRQQAEKEGRAAGQRAIEQITAQQVSQQMASALPALKQAIAEVEQARHDWLEHWQRQAIRLASAMAARVIRRELASQPEITLQLVRETLELASGRPQVDLHLNPADHRALESQVAQLVAHFGRVSQISLVADASVSAGGFRLQSRHGVIDQQIESQLARIENELNAT